VTSDPKNSAMKKSARQFSFSAVPAGGSTTQRRSAPQGYLAGSGPPDRGGELDEPLGQAKFPALTRTSSLNNSRNASSSLRFMCSGASPRL
jgi:hypothetical protein